MTDGKSYEVGYGKPPKQFQFKPGTSGNPNGRPKTKPSLETILSSELGRTITVAVEGQPMKLSQGEVMVKTFVRLAMNGNVQAAKVLIDIWRMIKDEPVKSEAVSADEMKLLSELLGAQPSPKPTT
ncbi:hypothetical protein ASG17_12875 [Brevundimonas sp. Leaf363]|uniref:DUF5681 domain-containing protein n=1 Tax=Brevundimonas sp. Leaf363 TaxID=1736353 RepID=UPI0006F60065|nr:DUF5681 domain-containing protein [Brevundimonas sp. Leaf363]KQS53853.1 hypothetical protein ASG17_12875 [Brevundimonas sp. Leaf363]